MRGKGKDLEITLPPRLDAVAPARHRLADWLRERGVSEPAATDLVTAASELCTNGVKAAHSEVHLHAFIDRDAVVIEVTDDGPGVEGELHPPEPDPLAEKGWGLYVAREMVDVLWVGANSAGDGTRARCAKRVT